MSWPDAAQAPSSRLAEVRTTYDTVASDYATLIEGLSAEAPFELGMLNGFAATIMNDGGGLVADVGCGPGRVTEYLHALGPDVFGIDLSSGMIDVARRTHPSLRFEVGTMTALDLPAGALAGVLAWYSIIHTPADQLPAVFEEFNRVLRPGGNLLLGFHVGTERRRMTRAYGHDIGCDAFLFTPDQLGALLVRSGFGVRAQLLREPVAGEKYPQSVLLARKG